MTTWNNTTIITVEYNPHYISVPFNNALLGDKFK